MSRAVSCTLSDIDMAEPTGVQRRRAVLSDTREQRSLPAVVRLPRRMPPRQAAPAASERAPYEKTVLPHVAYLRSRAWRLTRSPERADDLVQETCLKALKALHRFRPGSNARAWLDRILKNTFMNEWRSLDLPMGTVMSRLYRARRGAARLLAASGHVDRTFPPAHCSVTKGGDTRAPAP